jgi:hypothetical protein
MAYALLIGLDRKVHCLVLLVASVYIPKKSVPRQSHLNLRGLGRPLQRKIRMDVNFRKSETRRSDAKEAFDYCGDVSCR